MSFRLVPKSVTLNDFERRNGPYYSRPHIASAIAGDCSILVVLFIYYSRLRIAPAIAEDCYILAVFYLFYFPPQIFRRPWADFRETLPHDAVHVLKYFYLLYGCSYVPPKIEGQKANFADLRTQNRHFEPRHSLMRGKSENLKQ